MDDKPTVIAGNFAKRASQDEADEYQAFSYGRIGNRPQLTLVIRQAAGGVRGFPYARFEGIGADQDESNGFFVRFGREIVSFEGRNLGELFGYVCNYRASEIFEADRHTAMQIGEGKGVVWKATIGLWAMR
jgi:hypothetical protein